MKILFIVRTYCAPDIRVERMTRSLTTEGYEVETFCLHRDDLPREQKWDGGLIRRIINVPESKGRHMVVKLLSVICFTWHVLHRGRRFNIVHCNDLDMLPLGILLKWCTFGRVGVIYDAHEYETEKYHRNGLKKQMAKFLEKLFIPFADHVITVSEAIADEYKRLYPRLSRPNVILNCPPFRDIESKDLFRKNLSLTKDQIIFLYQGGLFPNRGIEMIVDAFHNMTDKSKVIIFMGFGPMENYLRLIAEKEPNIFFHPAVTTNVLPDYTASADVGIIYYQNTCLNHYYCSPNKLFEYIMAGLPIIASDLYELRRILQSNHNGTVVANVDNGELPRVISIYDRKTIKKQSEQSIKLRHNYSWEQQESKLIMLYNKMGENLKS